MGLGRNCCEVDAADLPILGLTEAVPSMLTERHWTVFGRQGFLHLGPVLSSSELEDLRLALDRLVDSQANDAHLLERMSRLNEDPRDRTELRAVFDLMQHPLFHEVCANLWGRAGAVAIFRAELRAGVETQEASGRWRQNAAELTACDRDELVTIHVAVDSPESTHPPFEAVPGSHKLGLAVDNTAIERELRRHVLGDATVPLDLQPGEALLIHRWLVHRDPANAVRSGRMLSFWFADGRTRSIETGYPHLPMLVGEVSREPYPCVRRLERECAALRDAHSAVEEYARSLEAHREQLEARLTKGS